MYWNTDAPPSVGASPRKSIRLSAEQLRKAWSPTKTRLAGSTSEVSV
jgi:hypothetical protein